MSRSSETSSVRTRVFPFRSRTASSERTPPASSAAQCTEGEPHKPKKLNSLFHFNSKMDESDYNQSRQPASPILETNHRRRRQLQRQGKNDEDEDEDEEDDDDDEDSDNGTVQPGEGRYMLRVINPDPTSDSSSSSSSDEEDEQETPKRAIRDQDRKNEDMQDHATAMHNAQTPHVSLWPPSTKLEISAPALEQGGSSSTAFVTQFLSTAPSPTASSLSLGSSSGGGGQPTQTTVDSRDGGSDAKNGASSVNASGVAPLTLGRRQSKTLHEKPGPVELLPPLDLTPTDWSAFTASGASKRLSNVSRGVLGSAAPSIITTAATAVTTEPTRRDNPPARPTMLEGQPLVETPLTLTPRTSRSSMQPQPQQQQQQQQQPFARFEPPSSLLSPSDSGIMSSSLFQGGPRSIATTTNESVLTSTLTRSTPKSKYSKASFSLTNNRDALKLYREMAAKTNDPQVQLSFAKYLLEIAPLYDSTNATAQPQRSSVNELVKRGRASLTYHGMRRSSDLGDLGSADKKRALEEEGVWWVRRLAKQEVGEAAYMLATWMDESKYGCRPNPPRSQRLHEVAARAGIPESMYATAQHLEQANQHAAALRYYKDAAEKGLVTAVLRLAEITLHGELGQRQNMTTGLALLAQAAESATSTYPEPLFVFAQVLANTYPRADIPSELVQSYGGVDAAMPTFERAAALGHPAARSYMGYIYEHGLYGAPIDMAKSHAFYDLAAKNGHDAAAMLGLARLYNAGAHGPGDLDEAFRYDHDISHWLQHTGRDEDASFYWCQRAAEHGLTDALFLLGWYYETGFGTPKDHARAQMCYQRAAAKGHHDAATRLDHLDVPAAATTAATSSSSTHRRSSTQEHRRDSQQCAIM